MLGQMDAIREHRAPAILVVFNLENHRSSLALSQDWVSRGQTAFAFVFQTFLASALGFVLLQLLWYTLRRQYHTLKGPFTQYTLF